MKRKGLVLLVLFLSVFIFSCLGSFVRSNWDIWRYPEITDLKVGKLSYEIKEMPGEHEASGVLVPYGEYLVGLKHCFTPRMCHPFFGCIELREDSVLNRTYTIDGLEIFPLAMLDDIIIFTRSSELDYRFNVKWGNADDLRVGDRLLSVGNTELQGTNFREGIVGRLMFEEDPLKFVASFDCINGDSGSPVLYMKRGKLYIAGLTQGGIRGGEYTMVIKAEKIRKALDLI